MGWWFLELAVLGFLNGSKERIHNIWQMPN